MISREFADAQLRRLMIIPFFRKIGAASFEDLIRVSVNTARCEDELRNAITALVEDEHRASNPQTHIPPSAAELIGWIRRQQPEDAYAQQTPKKSEGCYLCINNRPPGWITTERIVNGFPHTFSGKCPVCNSPEWYATKQENGGSK